MDETTPTNDQAPVTGATAPSTTSPPTAEPATEESAVDHAAEAAKYRRLHEKAQRQLEAATNKLKEHDDARLSEQEKLQRRADEAEARVQALERDALRRRVAQEEGLVEGAVDFLTASTEEEMRTQAARLKSLVGARPVAGTTTNPSAAQQPSMQEQIAAAERAGQTALAITLKRRAAGLQ